MRLTLVTLALGLAAIPAVATFAADPKPGAGRYELQPNETGFVRLDTVTGAISHCRPVDGAWACERLDTPDADARLEHLAGDIARLQAAVGALAARLDRLDGAGVAVAAEPAKAPPALATFADRVVERFLAMVRLLKHGPDGPRDV